MATALVLMAEGFEEVEAVAIIDVLRRAGVTVTVAALNNKRVCGAHGLVIEADTVASAQDTHYDAIILPGGQPGTTNLGASPLVISLLQTMNANGAICAAICAAPSVLALAGLLKGKRATCYPGVESQLDGAIVVQDVIVQDGNIVTSRGVGTALWFALALAALLVDPKTAAAVREKILCDNHVPTIGA